MANAFNDTNDGVATEMNITENPTDNNNNSTDTTSSAADETTPVSNIQQQVSLSTLNYDDPDFNGGGKLGASSFDRDKLERRG